MTHEQTARSTFPIGGIYPNEHKEATEGLPIEAMPCPAEVTLFLKQHVGVPCELTVKPKDSVVLGQMIGTVGDKLGAPLHASVSGTVKAVKEAMHPLITRDTAVVLSADPVADAADRARMESAPVEWRTVGREELLNRMKNAGLVGLGGAGFPVYAKVNLKPDVKVDTLILNGAECEPYVTCDHRIMLQYAREIVEGAKILMRVIGNQRCLIGIEANKMDAVEALKQAIGEAKDRQKWEIDVRVLQVKYPQGAADQIMESLTGRVRPAGKRSSSIGIIVQNVYSTKTVYDGVVLGRPLFERVITVAGKGIARQANLLVRIGTSIADIAAYLGGTTDDLDRIVVGGPMMGVSIGSLDVPIMKYTPGILFLGSDEVSTETYGPCISCGFCLQACPMGLEPHNISKYVEAGRAVEAEKFGVEDECFECGSCAFCCPAHRPLVQFIKIAKAEIDRHKRQQKK